MKIALLIFCSLLALSASAQESTLLDNPVALLEGFRSDGIQGKIETLETLDALTSSQVVDMGTIEYLVYTMLAQEPIDSRVQIAQNYLLNHDNKALKETGLDFIIDAAIEGIDALDVDGAKSQLVDELEGLLGTSQDYYAYAGKTSRALVMLGDDRGLDVFLTNSKTIRNYSRKDGWSEDSSPLEMRALSQQYAEKFNQSQSNEWDFFWSKFYKLAEERRKKGKLLAATDPLINLDSVLDGTFEPKLVEKVEAVIATMDTEIIEEPVVKASEVIEEVTATESEIEEEEEEEPTEPVEEDIEQSSNRWLWLAAAVLVVGGLSLVVRRRG